MAELEFPHDLMRSKCTKLHEEVPAAEAFSKVSSISISHSEFRSELIFENVRNLHFRCIFMMMWMNCNKSAYSCFM